MSNFSPKKIIVFSDHRPGHEKQTFGILRYLNDFSRGEHTIISCDRQPFFQQLFSFLSYRFHLPSALRHDLSTADLLIGTGTHTHLKMLQYKKKYGVPVVTCMTPASYIRQDFDIIFSPVHDELDNGWNVVKTFGPPNSNTNEKKHDISKTLILVGGIDTRSHSWNDEELLEYIHKIVNYNGGKTFTISSSPRTSEKTVTLLNTFSITQPAVSFYPYQKTAKGWIEEQYRQCKEVWVTADSMSMVYEALSSGCNVGILPVKWKRKNNKFSKSLNYLKEQGYVLDCNEYLTKKQWMTTASLNEAERCAHEIVKRMAWKDSM